MTPSTASVGTVPSRHASRSVLATASLTVLWTLLIYRLPIIPASGVPTTAHQLTVHALVAAGLWIGLERADLTPDQRRTTWLAVVIPYTLWFAVAWSASINGVFRVDASPSSVPLLPLAIFVPVLIGAPMLLSSTRIGRALDATPTSWLVAVQLYRVLGSWALAAWLRGQMPGAFALPAGIGDVLTGVLALPIAIAVATGTAEGRKAAILWNVFGLADFAVAVTMGVITSAGPLQLIFPKVPSIGAGAYPDVLTPAFVVPSSILLHVLSLRQLVRRSGE
jgi:hypothetical protein